MWGYREKTKQNKTLKFTALLLMVHYSQSWNTKFETGYFLSLSLLRCLPVDSLTYSLQKVESPSLFWIWNDASDSSLKDHRLDDDRQVTCKHYCNLENKMWEVWFGDLYHVFTDGCELDGYNGYVAVRNPGLQFIYFDSLWGFFFLPLRSLPGTRLSTPLPSVRPVTI